MQITAILKRIQCHHGFVFGSACLMEKATRLLLEIEIRPRKGSRPLCSICGKHGPGYDTLGVRRFEFVPLWGIAVFFLYAMRRVNCSQCGIKVERVPWAEGKNHLTTTYAWFLNGPGVFRGKRLPMPSRPHGTTFFALLRWLLPGGWPTATWTT